MDGSNNNQQSTDEQLSTTAPPEENTIKAAQANNNLDQIVENGKNKLPLFCTRCPSKILNANVGNYVKREQKLPKMSQKKNDVEIECEVIGETFQLKDIFQFENVGFCHPVDQLKYLSCSECELGPIGWQEIRTNEIFVAISRVRFALDV